VGQVIHRYRMRYDLAAGPAAGVLVSGEVHGNDDLLICD
jgi:hypothetical protein